MNWHGKKVAVLGYGLEGQSSVSYFLKQGAQVDVHDDSQNLDQLAVPSGVTFLIADQAFSNLNHYDLIVRSPGVRPDHSGLLSVDQSKITSQTKLFLQRWRNNCVGITGSKGKGTTSTLLAYWLQKAGKKCLLGGNIGVPVLDLMDEMDDETIAVLELSSFQLCDIDVSPAVAVALTIVPEHLNYHDSVEAYVAAKQHIVSFQHTDDLAIINNDYDLSKTLIGHANGQTWKVGSMSDCQARIVDDRIQFSIAHGQSLGLHQSLFRGQHNLENIAAAGLAALYLGVSFEVLETTLPEFHPLPHRLELIGNYKKMSFYNDSFATTPEATMAAMKSFDEPMALIIGGADKGSDFSQLILGLRLCENLCGVVAIGQIGPELVNLIQRAGIRSVLSAESMIDAVNKAAAFVKDVPEAVVLLSPGAASFGMFKDYKDRGQQFTDAARQLIKSYN